MVLALIGKNYLVAISAFTIECLCSGALAGTGLEPNFPNLKVLKKYVYIRFLNFK